LEPAWRVSGMWEEVVLVWMWRKRVGDGEGSDGRRSEYGRVGTMVFRAPHRDVRIKTVVGLSQDMGQEFWFVMLKPARNEEAGLDN
jgi:hypothetical protein